MYSCSVAVPTESCCDHFCQATRSQHSLVSIARDNAQVANNQIEFLEMSRDDIVVRNYNLEGEVERLYGIEDHAERVQRRLRIAQASVRQQQRRLNRVVAATRSPASSSQTTQTGDHHQQREAPTAASTATQTTIALATSQTQTDRDQQEPQQPEPTMASSSTQTTTTLKESTVVTIAAGTQTVSGIPPAKKILTLNGALPSQCP